MLVLVLRSDIVEESRPAHQTVPNNRRWQHDTHHYRTVDLDSNTTHNHEVLLCQNWHIDHKHYTYNIQRPLEGSDEGLVVVLAEVLVLELVLELEMVLVMVLALALVQELADRKSVV